MVDDIGSDTGESCCDRDLSHNCWSEGICDILESPSFRTTKKAFGQHETGLRWRNTVVMRLKFGCAKPAGSSLSRH